MTNTLEQASKTQGAQSDSILKTRGEKAKLIVAAGVGNFLEIFDFTVYSFFSAIIANVFFPTTDRLTGILISVSIFGVGFVMRPLGSILIGSYADKHGRKAAMLLTIVMMALGSALIGFAPTPDSVGIYAAFFIVIGRLLQGFSAGGEIGAATTLLMESAAKKQRGFFVSWQFIGQGFSSLSGSLFAAGLMHYLTPEQLHVWGWRVPFIFSLLIIPVGLYIRAHINETYEGKDDHDVAHDAHPFITLITEHTQQVFCGIFYILPVTALMYILVFYMPNYLKTVTDIGDSQAFLISSYASVITIIMSVISGFWCDALEKRKRTAFGILVVSFISAYFAFHFVGNMTLFMVFHSIGVACLGLITTFSVLMIMESFQRNIRATATAVIYAFSVSLFGGTAQMVVTQLLRMSNSNSMAPFWYLATALIIGMIALFFFKEERHEI